MDQSTENVKAVVTNDNISNKKIKYKKDSSEKRLGYLMVAPALIIIILIAIYPIIKTFWNSFFDMQLQNPDATRFVGLKNYIKMSVDPVIWQSLWNTFYFTFFSVIIELVLGFVLALIMNTNFKGKGIVRTSILIPWAIPGIIVALMWQFMFNDKLGVINELLINLHIIKTPIVWLGTRGYAMWSIIIADVWKQLPFMALMLLAGLQIVPTELYEAADVDGAGYFRKFWNITLPYIKNVVIVVLLFRIIGSLRIFDTIYGMTAGGPGNSTVSIIMYAYKQLFNNLDIGYGSAVAMLTFAIIFILCLVYLKFLGSKSEE
ncbi:sugar ABC transporter permease [Clostridium sp.]|jgi:multiple sugar transport system permease protein|uniref:carbohydrate ABC transporter permease n=1 Tax=Clostridium sp. TaxID=1506 RepID=UPI00259004F7|nr:sugar ABC transporter permease [Clostridium sp.]MDF2504718.1 permease component of ABC-type sugar transporter [Clostridium sp.]